MIDATNTMTPRHPRWAEFIERLNGPEGCNFREDEKGPLWDCGGGSKPKTRAILETMGVDVAESLAYFAAHGGHCDCEIVFNVGDHD